MRQLIRRILKEEREQDMGPAIKELLNMSLVPNYKKIICDIDVVAPWKREPIGSFSEFKDYQIIVKVIGGVGSKRWPVTQFVRQEGDKIVNDVWHTVYNFLGASTDIFLKNVKSCDELMNEGELTERCWKGYTQKGMKTMFGKRYPNCVKIKKKRVNESKMLDYLKQFLSGEVLDNYKKEKGRKEFQKMIDMVYKITSKDNPIEGMVGVLVGHIDKSMWGTTYTDPNSVGSRWDFKVILKPLFTNYNPNNDHDYNERVLNFEKEFNENARGMGFEVLSPIQHDKVKNYKVTFEWASRLDVQEI